MTSVNKQQFKRNINRVISPSIFKETINTVLKSPEISALNYGNSLTSNHFNNSINGKKFSNLMVFLQFENANRTRYDELYTIDHNIVRTTSRLSNTPLKRLNIFQIVSLIKIFNQFLNNRRGSTAMKNYLLSIKEGNNQSAKNIRLLYTILLFEFNERFVVKNMNGTYRYSNLILKHYAPNNLSNLTENVNLALNLALNPALKAKFNEIAAVLTGKKIGGKKKTTGKKIRKIHEGQRGGKYYITKGGKVYI